MRFAQCQTSAVLSPTTRGRWLLLSLCMGLLCACPRSFATQHASHTPWLLVQSDADHKVQRGTGNAFTGQLDLLATTLFEDGETQTFSIAGPVLRDGDFGADQALWAPSGRFAVFSTTDTPTWSQVVPRRRVFWVPFDDAGPLHARLIDNLPVDEEGMTILTMSRDSRLLLTRSRTSVYVSRFDADETSTKPVAKLEPGAEPSYAFCADSRHAVVDWGEAGKPSAIIDVAASELTSLPLQGQGFQVSPDGQWIAGQIDSKLYIGTCSGEPAPVDVPLDLDGLRLEQHHPPDWSPDSRFVELYANDPGRASSYALFMSRDDVSGRWRQVYRSSLSADAKWGYVGHGVLMTPWSDAPYMYLDPSQPKPMPQPVATPGTSTPDWSSAEGFWVEQDEDRSDDAKPSKVWFVSTAAPGVARLVGSHVHELIIDAESEHVAYVANAGSGRWDIVLADLSGTEVKSHTLFDNQPGDFRPIGFLPGSQYILVQQRSSDVSPLGKQGVIWLLGSDGSSTALVNGNHGFTTLDGLQPIH